MMRKKAVIEICKFTGQGNWREFRRSNSYFITRRCISGISGVRILNRTTASLSKSPSNLSFHRSLSSDHNVFYSVIHAAETSFKTIHTFSGLPWWAVIISTTVIARSLVTLPLAIHQNRTIAIMELLLPTLKEYQEAVKHNVIVKCRRQNLPVDEANRRIRKAVKISKIEKKFISVFYLFFRLRKWRVIFILRKVVIHIKLQCCHGYSCLCGSLSLFPSEI